jgi:MFS superfamily sulfate permease-like transporter
MVTGLAFFVSVFFAPIFASIPSWATGGALVIVGTLMVRKCVIAISRFRVNSLTHRCLGVFYTAFLKSTGITSEMQSLLS